MSAPFTRRCNGNPNTTAWTLSSAHHWPGKQGLGVSKRMKLLVTGAAGFIGQALSIKLLERGDEVIGVDNLNDYYDVTLKQARLEKLLTYDGFTDNRISLEDNAGITGIFKQHRPDRVVNLAAQA